MLQTCCVGGRAPDVWMLQPLIFDVAHMCCWVLQILFFNVADFAFRCCKTCGVGCCVEEK
jgi:hypothetical protein